MSETDQREQLLNDWLSSFSNQVFSDIRPASSDASFRRYFRVTDKANSKNFIVMDAPPGKEDCEPFIHVTKLLRDVGVNAPEIIDENRELGFLLLSDLGDQVYLDHLNEDTADGMYTDAFTCLARMQKIEGDLPRYDEKKLRDELNLFEPWYLNKHLNIQLDEQYKTDLNSTFELLINNAKEQPQKFVHRDYHSRNLMITSENNPGVIDYQDAVIGPITYDLVSLLKDCYIEWMENRVYKWIDDYIKLSGYEKEPWFNRNQFVRWFDFMGVQRHLKVLGIFCRLNYRDNKKQYINDLPLTLKYVVNVCRNYNELGPLQRLLENHVLNHPLVSEE